MKTAYIVGISVPAAEFRARLAEIPGAVLVRELPSSRVVVVLPGGTPAKTLASLPGVTSLREDRPERLSRPDARDRP
ncbi:hypothetical protein DQ384_01175 [Sphaerisporangium album]|uniref:Inhibitor I9 domain-containing protein n=1 Tax=Sphaerisporangium album TaxID=509200 RepID=A0A367FTR1_9ACTN|nr:hypothetical protein [Sphaerisporangium album]RCG33087.1 hypothetical protein DQ384_01175 [Sphaerisporangium album]